MDDDLYYIELKKQLDFVFISINDINNELKNMRNMNNRRFWYSIQSFLVSTANISKILYPSNTSSKRNKNRAERLRKNLGLSDKSVLKSKYIRNCFEHFDEKLDDFIEDITNNNGNFVDSNISDTNFIYIKGMPQTLYLRNYNPRTNVLTFKNKSYELQPIINELIKLNEKIKMIEDKI